MGFTGRESGGNSFWQCNGTQSLFHRLYSYSPTTRTLYQVMSDSEAKPPTKPMRHPYPFPMKLPLIFMNEGGREVACKRKESPYLGMSSSTLTSRRPESQVFGY